MVSIHGGKYKYGKIFATKIIKYLCDNQILNKSSKNTIYGYCEPFFGMGSVYMNILNILNDFEYPSRIELYAGDINKSLIKMWKYLQKGKSFKLSQMTKKNYWKHKKMKKCKESAERGMIGYLFSYGGIYFGIPSRNISKQLKEKTIKEYNKRGAIFKNVKFSHGDYTQFSKLKNCIIYCDPPYYTSKTTSRYYDDELNRLSFNMSEFFEWCKKMKNQGNYVFVSGFSKLPLKHKTLYTYKTHKLFAII
jgi:site-specific DNA-adenine methylase